MLDFPVLLELLEATVAVEGLDLREIQGLRVSVERLGKMEHPGLQATSRDLSDQLDLPV